METRKCKKLLSMLLVLGMAVPLVNNEATSDAAKVPKLSLTKITNLNVGKSKKIQIKSNGVKKIVKVRWKSSKKAIISVSKSSGSKVTVKALKVGKATITATVSYKIKARSKTLSKKLKCNITAKNALIEDKTDTTAPVSTTAPTATNTQSKNTPAANTASPAATSTATQAPISDPLQTVEPGTTAGPQNLISSLSGFVKNVGTCMNIYGGTDNDTTAYIKENFNSITAENQMKPEGILGRSANKITVAQAKDRGIFIPDNYKEATVPVLDYNNIDTFMKYAHDNGIRLRYHGLLWHEQTSNWFFRQDYAAGNAYVTPDVMDARIEYFIKNIMEHVYTSTYADVIYCWDVVNEFYHMTECISRVRGGKFDTVENANSEEPLKIDKNDDVKCYYEVYGKDIFEDPSDPAVSHVKTNPAYVKKAFKWAHEELVKFNKTDTVELVYNDYDTNFPDVRASIIAITKFINAKDDINPNGEKLVTTVGMQTHDKISEKYTIASHEETMSAIRDAGLNLQVTEMDLAMNSAKGHTVTEQLQYWEDYIKLIIKEHNTGANITGLTWWGMTDAASWLTAGESPLLCGSSVKDKKEAYYKVIDTAYKFKNLVK